MDTNSLKRFSTEARTKLKTGVAMMMQQLGFDAAGHASSMPERIGGGALLNGTVIPDDRFYDRWMSLYHAIQLHGVREVYEEVAYTWFNRFMAIRIMRMNGFISPVLEYQSQDARIPCIVANARRGIIPPMPELDRRRLDEILLDDSKTSEQFAILIVAYCQNNPVLSRIFGRVNDYTALLLPKSILAPGDFVDMLNNTPFIKPEDYRQSELIGWLYQFYISEKKDEVFAAFKNGSKAEAEDIPAATQIFTPNWIVKYMAQNTLGRIYLDNNPGSPLEEKWKYLVPQSDSAKDAPKLKIKELEDLTLIDPGSGSGHILVEGFDMLYDMYAAEFASPREACEAILTKNITGIDIDTRAKQLAQFSLLMKACQKDDSFLDAKILPRVYDMPDPWENKAGLYELLKRFFARDDKTAIEETIAAITLMDQAKNLGSIMKFKISDKTRFQIERRMGETMDDDLKRLVPFFDIILALTGKYAAVCANPPYMGFDKFNDILKAYVVENYPIGKQDFFTIFMDVASNQLRDHGLYGMINMQSWMYLASFEDFRNDLFTHCTIKSMLHLGPHTFDELSGEVVQNTAFIIQRDFMKGSLGVYYRLVEGVDCGDKQRIFEDALNGRNLDVIYNGVSQDDFCIISGSPVLYDMPKKAYKCFLNETIEHYCLSNGQNITGDNGKYLRLLWEVDSRKVRNDYWALCARGGGFRRYYGNVDNLILWTPAACAHYKKDKIARIISPELRFRLGITWSYVCSGRPTFRVLNENELFEKAGTSVFVKEEKNLYSLLGLVNSKVASFIYYKLAPSTKLQVHDMFLLPVDDSIHNDSSIKHITKQSIGLAKSDWDAHETSWDFQGNEILGLTTEKYVEAIHGIYEGTGILVDIAAPKLDSLEWRVGIYKQKWEDKFRRLHANEEELNRKFIDIYGLQDELTPDVPLDEVTILQQGEIKIEDNAIVWNDEVIIKQLISYIVGCHMGRYRLDRPGLAIAYPDATSGERAPYLIPGTSATFTIDEDALIPLLPAAAGIADNGVQLVRQTIIDVLGSKNYASNLNYIENCLGKSLEDYMAKDFWNDHKKMYQNRPIYWLFSSKKGAFKVVAYMHRMTKYTVEQIRQKYLLPYIDKLKGQAEEIQAKGAGASASERRSLQGLLKNIAECEEYHTRLHSVAEKQLYFDLDDGVVKNYALFGDVLAKIK